jgi:hypothetical protein
MSSWADVTAAIRLPSEQELKSARNFGFMLKNVIDFDATLSIERKAILWKAVAVRVNEMLLAGQFTNGSPYSISVTLPGEEWITIITLSDSVKVKGFAQELAFLISNNSVK